MSKNALHKREGNLESSRICDAGFAGYTEANAVSDLLQMWLCLRPSFHTR